MYCKLKPALAAALMIMKQPVPVAVLQVHVPKLTYFDTFMLTPLPTLTTCNNMTKNASGIDFFTAILLVTSITTFLIWLTRKKFQKTDNHTVLKLELTNGKQCVMLDILTLPMYPRHYHPKADNYVSNFLVGSFIRPKLLMNWNGLTFTNMITNTIFEPSTAIYINLFMSARIKNILKDQFCAYVLLYHKAHAFHFRICQYDCDLSCQADISTLAVVDV